MICHSERITMLTERAKSGSSYINDLDIGESCYLLSLLSAVRLFRLRSMTSDELFHEQKRLEQQLLRYYQHRELFDHHVRIGNRYSEVLTDAEKHGCPICRKLIRILDGRTDNGFEKEGKRGEDLA